MTPMPMSAPQGLGAPGMAPVPPMPPMPSPEQLEEDKLIAEACSWEEIAGVLHSDDRRNYTVDVETDATAFEDVETEKQQRIEYIRAMTEMMQVWIPAIQGNPTLAPFAKELAIFGSGAFKPGRQFEEQLGDAFDQIQNMPPQPNPEAEKLKAEAEREDKKFAMEAQSKQADAAAKARERQQDLVFKEKDYALKEREMQTTTAFKAKELAFKEQELVLKAQDQQMSRVMAAEQANNDREDRAFERQAKAEDRETSREDRQYERQHQEREFALKGEEVAFKRQDMDERRHADIQDKTERRELEAGFVADKVGKSTSEMNERVVGAEAQRQLKERDGLRREVTSLAEKILEQQALITEVLQDLRRDVDQTQDVMLTAIKRMSAPRRIVKDPKTGKTIGMEIVEEVAA